MLKKLQNLLFEDEDVVEETEDTEIEEVAPKPKKSFRKKKTEAPVKEETHQPVEMQRIDVTQAIPTVTPVEKAKPRTESVFREEPVAPVAPVVAKPVVEEEKPKPIAMSVDDMYAAASPKKAPARAKKEKAYVSPSGYEFKPVISPIFGVDEKDIDAVQTTSRKAAKQDIDDTNVSPIISPMYGENTNEAPSTIQKTVEKSAEIENMNQTFVKEKAAAEEDVPAFSLDEFLKVRDEEFAQKSKQEAGPAGPFGSVPTPKESNDPDQTVVINSRNLSLFDDESGSPKDSQ